MNSMAKGQCFLSIIYLHTPWCRVLLEKLTGLQLVKKFPRISRNPKVHYRTRKRPAPVSILGQPNPVHIPTSHLLEIHRNIIHPSMPRSPQWSPSLRVNNIHEEKLYFVHVNAVYIFLSCGFHNGDVSYKNLKSYRTCR